jgi:hypothetical protein
MNGSLTYLISVMSYHRIRNPVLVAYVARVRAAGSLEGPDTRMDLSARTHACALGSNPSLSLPDLVSQLHNQ